MLLIREVVGPERAEAGETVTYRVTRFNAEDPPEDQMGGVNWLVKSADGVALTNIPRQGAVWNLIIPASWAGQSIHVMPYLHSATLRVSVETRIAPLRVAAPLEGGLQVRVFQEDRRYYASVNGEPRFYVGTDVAYGPRRGLMNSANPYGPRYDPLRYEPEFGCWAHYLLPTIGCESKGAFNCINTYDRARFTFGHMQFAAHTPNENFVLVLRELLRLPAAAVYFPDLLLREGSVHQRSGEGLVRLEDPAGTEALQAYLNPNPLRVEQRSVEVAACLMDWCAREGGFSETLAVFAFKDQQRKLRQHAARLPLNGLSDKLCLVIMDILHQGRGKYTSIRAALQKDDPFDALLAIGGVSYRERVGTLRAGILELERKGLVGQRAYSLESGDFVPADGA